MHKASTSAECCPHFDNLPTDIRCFVKDLKRDWRRIARRQKFTRRCRILRLAEPRHYRRARHIPKCPCMFRKPITLIRDFRQSTRTEQLAFPSVRKLLLFKERVRLLYPPERVDLINRLIRYSLFSLYSRLGNIQPPKKKIPIKKWDKDEWKQHTKYLKQLAKHKVPPPVPELPNNQMPLNQMNRYKTLANPKQRFELVKEDWALTPAMKKYTPTEVINKLAQPQTRDDSALHKELPVPIEPSALKYKPSARIKELATHRERGVGEMDLKENPFGISPNALKAKASKRTQELAEPKEYENTHIRDNPNMISPAALKAKASPRIIELAKPKGS